MPGWLADLERRHAATFHAADWPAHVRSLNDRVGLSGRHALVESRWPPEFFWAALPRFRAGQWLAVVSLNPREMNDASRRWHESEQWAAESYWRYLTRQDLRGWTPSDFYVRKWAYPLLLILSALTDDESLLERPEEAFLDSVGNFDLLPYPSYEYWPGTFAAVGQHDPGAVFARDVTMTAVANCPPAAILANGLDAVPEVARWLGLEGLTEHAYASPSRPGRRLRHWQSEVVLGKSRVPFVGVPFLRSQGGHNSYDEIRLLVREVVARR